MKEIRENNWNNRLNSTEFIAIDGAVNGPILPEAVSNLCAVKYPDF